MLLKLHALLCKFGIVFVLRNKHIMLRCHIFYIVFLFKLFHFPSVIHKTKRLMIQFKLRA